LLENRYMPLEEDSDYLKLIATKKQALKQ